MRTLTNVRRDIVQTIRQVVDVVSQYAGGALPEPARGRVRGFILELPQRWAKKAPGPEEGEREREKERERESVAAASGSAVSVRRSARRTAGHRGRGTAASSAASSRAASPVASLRHSREAGESVPASTAILAAQRILTLATESLDMVRGVTGVVKDSLDRADACVLSIRGISLTLKLLLYRWVGRLRTVGIQRPSSQGGGAHEENASTLDGSETDHDQDPEHDTEVELQGGHRRVNSVTSSVDDSDAGMSSSFSGSSYFGSGGSSVPSTPGVTSFEAMHLGEGGTRFSTPKSSAVGLADDDAGTMRAAGKYVDRGVVVKIVGMDVGEGEGEERAREGGNMDVDG